MRGWAVGGVVVLATVVGMGGPALGNSDCVDMLDQKDVRSTMGDSWSADVRCGKTAAWDARGRTWVLGRQRWFVDDLAPANRTGLRVFPARMALASFFRSSNYGSHVVVKRRTFILIQECVACAGGVRVVDPCQGIGITLHDLVAAHSTYGDGDDARPARQAQLTAATGCGSVAAHVVGSVADLTRRAGVD